MLSLSKHSGRGLSARTLRRAQGDNARWFVTLLFLFFSTNMLGQAKDVIRTDTSIKVADVNSVDKDALYVINGEVSQNKLNGIDPKDIFSISIIKKGKALDPSLGPYRDVVVVLTKTGAIKAYQKKFSAFSKDYKNYIKKYNDNLLRYLMLNPQGNITSFTGDELISKLYNISFDSIESVSLMIKETCCGTNRFVIITTKR